MSTTVTYRNDPGKFPIDEVRLLVGDTDCRVGVFFLTDEEIQFRLDSESTTLRAARRSAEDILSRLARGADFSAGTQSQSKSQQFAHYKELVAILKRREAEYVAFTAGGLSEAEKRANEQDEDLVQGQFRSNQFRNTRTGASNQQSSIREVE